VAGQIVFDGKAFKVRRDTVRRPDGGDAVREVVEHPPVVAVIAVDDRDQVVLVRQPRPAVGQELLEIPAGFVDSGEEPEAAARRELAEEAGLAGDLRRLGTLFTSPGFTDERIDVYLATGLRDEAGHRPDAGEKIEVVWMAFGELLVGARSGELQDAKTVAALLLAGGELGRS
jgi:ADP-ribose pyrophosphatase